MIILEIWDGYNKDGTLAGIDLLRGKPIPQGLYHLVCEILVRHTDGDYLLMLRDPSKPNFGGYYEATAGGSALKGEDILACAKRELFEETGIKSEAFEPIGVYISKDTIYHSFLCVVQQDKDSVVLQKGETAGYKWVGEKEFAEFVNSESIIPQQKERCREYYKAMGYLCSKKQN